MIFLILAMIYITLITAVTANDKTYIIEAQHGYSTTAQQIYRSAATSGIAVLIKENGYLFINFRVLHNDTCTMRISNVRYSNDGLSDTVEIYLNGSKIGEIHSRAKSGNGELWNVFLSTGPVGNINIQATEGIYQLRLYVIAADEYGIEIDSINVNIQCKNSSGELIQVLTNGSIGLLIGTPTPPLTITETLTIFNTVFNSCVALITTVVLLMRCICYRRSKGSLKKRESSKVDDHEYYLNIISDQA